MQHQFTDAERAEHLSLPSAGFGDVRVWANEITYQTVDTVQRDLLWGPRAAAVKTTLCAANASYPRCN